MQCWPAWLRRWPSGAGLAEALRLGVACGAANTLAVGAGILRVDDVAQLRAATTLVEA